MIGNSGRDGELFISSTSATTQNSSSPVIDNTDRISTSPVRVADVKDREQLKEINRELVQFISRAVPSVDDIMSHNVVLDLVRDVARRVLDPSADIQMFGSAASGLCERGSDIDATVIVDFAILNKRFHGKNRAPSVGHETRLLCSEAVCAIAKYIEGSNGTGLAVEGLINGAKVPIVVLSSFGRQIIDVSINNVLPTFNTKLLGEYSRLDDRVVGLVLCVKRWAKMTQVSDAKMGNLSSYSWSILCLYYLQYVGVIPSLQARAPPGVSLYNCPSSGRSFDVGFLSGRLAIVEKELVEKSMSTRCVLSLAELLCGFFMFYDREFKWGSEVVSIRVGGRARLSITDPEFGLLSQGSRSMMELPPGTEKIHIEDPFDLSRNLHCVMDTEGLIRLRKAFKDIASKLDGASVSVLSLLGKTLMSYKNVVPAFSTAELNKRYGPGSSAGPTRQANVNSSPLLTPSVAPTIDNERAAEIVRNYAKQQEILEKQLLNLQQRGGSAATTSAPYQPVISAAAAAVTTSTIPQVVRRHPGRGSYKQRIESPRGGVVVPLWETVDLW